MSGIEENGDIRNLNISDQNVNTPHNTPHTDSKDKDKDNVSTVPVPPLEVRFMSTLSDLPKLPVALKNKIKGQQIFF